MTVIELPHQDLRCVRESFTMIVGREEEEVHTSAIGPGDVEGALDWLVAE